jgi:hypothetical protein
MSANIFENYPRTSRGKDKEKEKELPRVYILSFFLELSAVIKLYHWMTLKYSKHKATDKLYESLIDLSDTFVEVYLGRYGRNKKDFVENMTVKKMTDSEFVNYLKKNVKILENDFPKVLLPSDTDLFNIRDELLAKINQTLYLLTLE